jgi:hypothetical protein
MTFMALSSNLLSVTQADVEQLVRDGVREGPHLDFKRDVPAAWDQSAKHELLADVTALANAGGGDIVYGVDENSDAAAAAVVPQVSTGVDAEVRRIQDFLLSLSEPRLPAVQVRAVPVSVNGVAGHVVVIRVPQSWAGPHRVKTNQHFFIREGARKRQLDIPEIRALFIRSDSQAQRVRDFRTDRLAKILTGQTPCAMQPGPQLVIHAIPTQAAQGLVQLDPVPYFRRERTVPMLGKMMASGVSLNLDGVYASVPTRELGTYAYTQIFRQGFFEVHRRFPGNAARILRKK